MRAERVVPLFVAVAVKQSKHYAYLKSSAMCSHQQQFTHPESFFFPSILLGSAFGFAGADRLYSGEDPFLYDAFHFVTKDPIMRLNVRASTSSTTQ